MGFNMSWIFVDGIERDELYAVLDVKSTGEAADPNDLGTSRVPLAGLRPKAGWCAIFGQYSFVLQMPPQADRGPATPHLSASCTRAMFPTSASIGSSISSMTRHR